MLDKIMNQDIANAKTQSFSLEIEPQKLIEKIFSNNCIQIIEIEIPKVKNKKDYPKMHRRIKTAILKSEKENRKYSISNKKGTGKVFVFFISDNPTDSNRVNELLKSTENFDNIINALIFLTLYSTVVNELKEDLNIDHSIFNDNLYFISNYSESKDKDDEYYIDTFLFNSQFYKNIFSFSLMNKSFKTNRLLENTGDTEFMSVFFNDKVNKVDIHNSINATKYNKSNFMTFNEDYNKCKNYYLNLMHKKIEEIFSKYDIEYKMVNFRADYQVKDFLKFEAIHDDGIIIIDNYTYTKAEKIKKNLFYKLLKDELDVKKIINIKDFSMDQYQDDSILFLNNEVEHKSSIVFSKNDENKTLSSFSEAYKLSKKNNASDFDMYTQIKLKNFSSDIHRVTQGMNIDSIDLDYKKYDDFIQQHKDLKKKIKIPLAIQSMKFKLKKINREIWFKNKIFKSKILTDCNICDGEYILFFNRNVKRLNDDLISVVFISVLNKEIVIKSNKVYTDYEDLKEDLDLSILSSEKLNITDYNYGFYIYDIKNENLLINYNSSIVPDIIGNVDFNNIDKYMEDGCNLKKISKEPSNNPLPYYLVKSVNKQKNYTWVQDNGDSLYYFVSPKQNLPGNIKKQSLVFKILILNKFGEPEYIGDSRLPELFLHSFTDDFLNLNEVSKMSLLEKIAKEFLFE
jgi:hypothetical protein